MFTGIYGFIFCDPKVINSSLSAHLKLADSANFGCVPSLNTANQTIKYLRGDNTWQPLQNIFSEDGNYSLKMQTDGQIVIWSNGQGIWTNQRLASATNWGAMSSTHYNVVSKIGVVSMVGTSAFSKHSYVSSLTSGEAISIRIGGDYGYTAVSLNAFTISQTIPGDEIIFAVELTNGAFPIGDHYYALVSNSTNSAIVYIRPHNGYTHFKICALGNTVVAGTYRFSAVFPTQFG